MAMSSTASAAPMPPPPMPDDMDDDADAGAAPADDGAGEGDEDVLLTVIKEADGTYSLVKGDEDDADGADTAGSATPEDKQNFDSVGSLLKAILDVLKADEASAGTPGNADSQFQSGFDENAPPAPPAQMKQKY